MSSLGNHEILRYSGATGAYMDVFASGAGLSFPAYEAFGPDGNLYVADFGADQISRFNGKTGAYDLFALHARPIAFVPSIVPEPGSLVLLLSGGLLFLRRRCRF